MNRFARLRTRRVRLGRAGERIAAELLARELCDVLIRNCRTPRAELDIVARDGGTLVFVEVKTLRKNPHSFRPLNPAQNLSPTQRERISRGARSYLHDLANPKIPFRFDLIEVIWGRFGPVSVIHHRNIALHRPLKRRS